MALDNITRSAPRRCRSERRVSVERSTSAGTFHHTLDPRSVLVVSQRRARKVFECCRDPPS